MKKLSVPLYLVGFVYSIVLLVVGVAAGYYLNSQVSITLSSIVSSLEAQNSYLFVMDEEDGFCVFYREEIPILEKQSWEVGQRLELLEQKGKEDITLKQRYMGFLVRDLLLNKKAKELCNESFIEILYFYTNQEECFDCRKEGYELYKLREKLVEKNIKVKFYAFDGTLQGAGSAMATYYNVKKFPTVIIEGRKFEGFVSHEELLDYVLEIANKKNSS